MWLGTACFTCQTRFRWLTMFNPTFLVVECFISSFLSRCLSSAKWCAVRSRSWCWWRSTTTSPSRPSRATTRPRRSLRGAPGAQARTRRRWQRSGWPRRREAIVRRSGFRCRSVCATTTRCWRRSRTRSTAGVSFQGSPSSSTTCSPCWGSQRRTARRQRQISVWAICWSAATRTPSTCSSGSGRPCTSSTSTSSSTRATHGQILTTVTKRPVQRIGLMLQEAL